MTCADCKFFLPQQHTVKDRDCDGYCIRYPAWIHKNKTTVKCGEWKDKAPRVQTKNSTERTPEFKEFYAACPVKVAPGNAWKAWQKLLPKNHQLAIKAIKAYDAYVKSENTPKGKIKHPATWLNADCWMDNYDESEDKRACEDCGTPYQDGWKYYKAVGKKKYYRCDSCKANTKH